MNRDTTAWVRNRIETTDIYHHILEEVRAAARPMRPSEIYQALRERHIYEPYTNVRTFCKTLVTNGYLEQAEVNGVFAVQMRAERQVSA